MAERVTVKKVLQKISEGHLECQICMDRLKKPKMLECSHSFCLECLQQLSRQHTDQNINKRRKRWITCPVCRSQTSLYGRAVAELQTDFKLTSLLDEIEHHETELQSQPPSQESVSKCSKHTDKDVIMYCDSCKQLICTTCIAKDHRMHPAIELHEVVANYKKNATKLFAEVEQHHSNFKIAMEDIGTSRKTLDSVFAATRARISKGVARIRKEEKKLRVELEQTYKDRAKKIELAGETSNKEMTSAKNKKIEVIQLIMDESTFFVNLHLIEKLLQDLKDYTEIQPKQVPLEFAYMDFEDDQKSLGRLVLKEKLQLETAASFEDKTELCNPQGKRTQKTWMLKTERTHYMSKGASAVAPFSNSDVVVCDFAKKTLIKFLAESFSQSKVVAEELSIKGLINPRSVTVNKNDVLIVIDKEEVKIFNRTNTCLHQFEVCRLPFIQPPCIAVDDKNFIAVGSCNNISLHKPDGSLLRKLSAPGIGQYLTIHKQQLIYTKWDDKKLESIDYHGSIVFSVDINQSRRPRGLCCDKDGSIYVAVWDDKSLSGDIQQYSPDGRYIECIIKDCAHPAGITLTPAGDLVVASDASVQIYMYHCW